MPGEKIMIATEKYPELQGLQQGDAVSLKIDGKVSNVGENGELEITTDNIETELDDAAQFQKKMSRQPAMNQNYDDEGGDAE